jgi:hypothetical protein
LGLGFSTHLLAHHGELPAGAVYLADTLVTASTMEEHDHTLEKVLHRLDEAGVRLKREKCAFMLPMVEYLGHCISVDDFQPTNSQIKALKEAPVSYNVS